MNPDQAFESLSSLVAQSTIPCSWAQAHSLLTIVGAGLQEREAFRARLEKLEAPADDADGHILPFSGTDVVGKVLG